MMSSRGHSSNGRGFWRSSDIIKRTSVGEIPYKVRGLTRTNHQYTGSVYKMNNIIHEKNMIFFSKFPIFFNQKSIFKRSN